MWLPCELEALAIAVSLKHYDYYILQSTMRTRVLTDSKPCVLSYKKLQRGQFSSSPKKKPSLMNIDCSNNPLGDDEDDGQGGGGGLITR